MLIQAIPWGFIYYESATDYSCSRILFCSKKLNVNSKDRNNGKTDIYYNADLKMINWNFYLGFYCEFRLNRLQFLWIEKDDRYLWKIIR